MTVGSSYSAATGVTAARVWHGLTAVLCTASLLLQLVLSATADNDTATTRLIRYISFFTIQSNILVAIVSFSLLVDPTRDGRRWRVLRLLAVTCIGVTGIVYVSVLRGLVELDAAGRVADTGLHYVTPALVVVGWLLFGPRPRVEPATVGYALVFPVLWLAYTLVRGEFADWYPYPFVDVATEGYAAVLVNCVAVTLVFVAFASLVLLLDRRLPAGPGGPAGYGEPSTTPARKPLRRRT